MKKDVKLTEDELIKRRAKLETKKFIESVEVFLTQKNGGQFEEVWNTSLLLLASYFEQYILLDQEIKRLPSLVYKGKYGLVPSPLLACRDKACARLESLMKEMGITFKTSVKLNLTSPKEEESPLERFAKNKLKDYEE